MKKAYVILLFLVCLILLSTFTQSSFKNSKNNKNYFFKVKNLEIVNLKIIKEKEIKNRLDYIIGQNILSLKKKKIRNSVLGINFLKDIEVKKKYPNTILIKIIETIPVGILIKKEKKYLLDSNSNLILFNSDIPIDNLPNIFGENAENYFMIFLQKLKDNEFSYMEVKSFFYYKSGRWDIKLFNGKTIKFPNNKVSSAIKESVILLKRQDFIKYNIIDLRVDGGVIVE